MSTRANVIVYNEWNNTPFVNIYKHFDGYPDGLGETLKGFCEPFTITNGISGNDPEPFANGMGCFAAMLVAHLKNGPGDVYLYPLDSLGNDYTYHIRPSEASELNRYRKLILTYQEYEEDEKPL